MQADFEFADVNAFRHRFNKEKKLAGKEWVTDFSTIHQLALGTAAQCSVGRIIVFRRMQLLGVLLTLSSPVMPCGVILFICH
jgi:hypothetical protein